MFFTFEPYTKVSVESHEHATIQLAANGVVSILSREETRSVARKWDAIGTWNNLNYIRFTEDSLATRLVATQLKREGWTVQGIKWVEGEWSGAILKQESNGRITNPESIRGRIRDRNPGSPTDKRTKVQALFGNVGECHLLAMREAVLTRQTTRK